MTYLPLNIHYKYVAVQTLSVRTFSSLFIHGPSSKIKAILKNISFLVILLSKLFICNDFIVSSDHIDTYILS